MSRNTLLISLINLVTWPRVSRCLPRCEEYVVPRVPSAGSVGYIGFIGFVRFVRFARFVQLPRARRVCARPTCLLLRTECESRSTEYTLMHLTHLLTHCSASRSTRQGRIESDSQTVGDTHLHLSASQSSMWKCACLLLCAVVRATRAVGGRYEYGRHWQNARKHVSISASRSQHLSISASCVVIRSASCQHTLRSYVG